MRVKNILRCMYVFPPFIFVSHTCGLMVVQPRNSWRTDGALAALGLREVNGTCAEGNFVLAGVHECECVENVTLSML